MSLRVRTSPDRKFGTLKEALNYIQSGMDIPMKRWIKSSGILKDLLYQKRLDDFLDTGRPFDLDLGDENEG